LVVVVAIALTDTRALEAIAEQQVRQCYAHVLP
jgi:hypothetical protein